MDRSKFERMLVWDDKEKPIECIVISKHSGFCVVVDSDNEGFFLDKNYPIEDVCVVLYRHCKPIPKKVEFDLKVVVEEYCNENDCVYNLTYSKGDKKLYVHTVQSLGAPLNTIVRALNK